MASSFAIVGPSGSGKSTLGALLAGIDTPTSGSLVVAGTTASIACRRTGSPRGAGRRSASFQDFHLLPTLTAQENVGLTLELSAAGGGRRARRRAAEEALHAVGLGAHRRKLPRR